MLSSFKFNHFKLLFVTIILFSFKANVIYGQSQCPTLVNIYGNNDVCKGDLVELFAEIDILPADVTFTWTGSVSGVLKVQIGPLGQDLIYTPLVSEIVTILVEKQGCISKTDNVNIIIKDGATFTKCSIVDNFDEPGVPPQTVMVKAPSLGGPLFDTETFNGINGGGLLGNRRTMNIWYVSGLLTSRSDILQDVIPTSPYFGEWFYSSSNDDGNESNSELIYGGTGVNALHWNGACECLDANGNLLPTASFRLLNYFADQSGITMTVTLTDATGKVARITRNLPGSLFGDYDEIFLLSDFTVDAGFNWCDINMISIYMDTNNISVDFKFDEVDFCCYTKAVLKDNVIKKCLGSCLKLDTLWNCPIPSGGIQTQNVSWKDPNGNTLPFNAVVCPNTAGAHKYVATITDQYGCSSMFDLTFQVCDTPKINLKSDSICIGESTTLKPIITGGNAPLTYLWTPSTGLSCTTCLNPIANPTSTTKYTLTVYTTENGDDGITSCPGKAMATVSVFPYPNNEITGDTILCEGENSVQICAVENGNFTTYLWSPGGQTTKCINVGTGTYTVTVTNMLSYCSSTNSITVVQKPRPTVNVTADKSVVCEGLSTTLTATGSGGTSPYTYSWSTGQSGSSIQVTPSVPSSTYTVTITDNNGCSNTKAITITANPNTINISIVPKSDTCGRNVGSATATVSGGTQPYTILWSTGSTALTINGLSSGNYTVTVTDNVGCSKSAVAVIQNVNGPSASITGNSTICNGSSVTLTANGTGGTTPFTYLWNTTETTQSITVSPSVNTTYTVTITDKNNCTSTASVGVTVYPKPSVSIMPQQSEICLGSSVQLFTEVSGGTPGYTYVWIPSTGLSCSTCANPIATPISNQTYTVVVTDQNGCSANTSTTITVNLLPSLNLVSKTDEICGLKNGAITVAASGGEQPYNYLWNTTPPQAGATATGLSSGTYTVTVTDNNGCTATLSQAILNINGPNVSITGNNPICSGGTVTLTANGSGGTQPYTYLWSHNNLTTQSISVTPSITTAYTVTITDENNCSSSASVEVIVYPNPTVSIWPQPAEICQGSNIQLSLIVNGGTPEYSYSWTPSTGLSCTTCSNPIASPTSNQTYTVVVTDENSCSASASTTVNVFNPPTLNLFSKSDENCGLKNGAITVVASGGEQPYNYLWNTTPAQVGATATGLSSGTYTVTVTDNNGCTATLSQAILNINGPKVSITGNNPICSGGSVTLTANGTGGTQPFTYLWSHNNLTTQSISVSPSTTTTYTVTITDENNCSSSASVEVIVYPNPTVSIWPQPAEICQGGNIQLSLIVNGGTPEYSYSWTPSTGLSCTTCSNPIASPTSNQTYTVVVTDENSCSASASTTVVVNNPPILSLVSKTNEECGMLNGSITVTASGGEQPYTYYWSTLPQQSGPIALGLSGGTYTVTVTDNNGCSATLAESIINLNGPTVTISGSNPNCTGDNVTLIANPSPKAPGNYTYNWSNGLGSNQTAVVNNVLATNTYTVTVTDIETGCTATSSFMLEVKGCEIITHYKEFTGTVQTGLNTYDVSFKITVDNIGTGNGKYELKDSIAFDKDVVVNAIKYSTNASGNSGNPGPVVPSSDGNDRYILATNQNITDSELHTYNLTVSVTLNLNGPIPAGGDGQYKPCKEITTGDYVPENGLYNLSILDTPNDKNDERDEACGDLPFIIHEKTLGSVVPTGPNLYDVTYQIRVKNIGGARGYYTLQDQPSFDDDITILGGNYSGGLVCCGAFINTFVGNPGTITLINNTYLDPGFTDVFSITFQVEIDLSTTSSGNNIYTSCGNGTTNPPQSEQGLFNQSLLDVNIDGAADYRDTVCADLPYIIHEKTLGTVVPTGPNLYDVTYQIRVKNIGGARGYYSLQDQPSFDDDITILGGKYSGGLVCCGAFINTFVGNPGTITLINNSYLDPGLTDVFSITFQVEIDLSTTSSGNNIYTSCGNGTTNPPQSQQGLFNQSLLDVNVDGRTDYRDTACTDLPYIVHEKRIVSVTNSGQGNYTIVYGIKVDNLGGYQGEYDLTDSPAFDDDFAILNAQYTSTAPGHPANPISLVLPGVGPWNIANDQIILANASHDYLLTVNVNIDLVDATSAGDEIYRHCGSSIPGVPSSKEGLFNESLLDINNDGILDQKDTVCTDVKIIDLALKKTVLTAGPYKYGNLVTFRMTVFNQGNTAVENVKIADYLPAGLKFEGGDPNWTVISPNELEGSLPGILNPNSSKTIDITLRVVKTSGGECDWVNFAEVKRAYIGTDEVSDEDIDSNPYSNSTKEKAVKPGSPDDDVVTEDGKNNPDEDEDDHDPAGIEIFDLALRKTTTSTGPVKYGSTISFKIDVINQGSKIAKEVSVVEYLASGMVLTPNNPGWLVSGTMATTIIPTILPGETASVNLNFLIIPVSSNFLTAWYNEAEIKQAKDVQGIIITSDIDSDFNMDPNDDNSPMCGDSDDDEINEDRKTNPSDDEDDNDPECVEVVDLALRKWVLNKKSCYILNEVVPFIITVFNQGNVTMSSVTVNDFLSAGYTFDGSQNPGWNLSGNILTKTQNVMLIPGDSIQIPLNLKIKSPVNNSVNSWWNYAEIKSMTDKNNQIRDNDDADSKPNSNSSYELLVKPGDSFDNIISGQGQSENEDEDDHDPENVIVKSFIGDYVWKDLNGDGLQNQGETPIQGVHVYLYKCNSTIPIAKDTTNANGAYGFDCLDSDSYYLRFDATPINMPNCAWTFSNIGSNDLIDSDVDTLGVTDCKFLEWGERDSTKDAGLVELACYGDYVWHDRNGDGMQSFNEEGIKDIKVELYNGKTNQLVRTAFTDNSGLYKFCRLMPQDYYAKFIPAPKSGWIITDANVGPDVKDSDLDNSNGPGTTVKTTLSPGEEDLTWDLGLYKCPSISGIVFYDVNNNGVRDNIVDNGINGVRIRLIDAMTGQEVAHRISSVEPGTGSNDGYYIFDCFKPGMYYIKVDRPGHLALVEPLKGFDPSKDSDINHDNGLYTSRKFTINSEVKVLHIGAGFSDKAVIGNYVWLDINSNGIQDQGEQPIENVHVAAYNSTGIMVSEAVSKADGTYELDGINQGDYYVKFDPPATFGFTIPKQGNDNIDNDVDNTNGYGTTRTYRILKGEVRPSVDAGLIFQVLPLEWLSFEANYEGNYTALKWVTGVEINNNHFEIERRHESEASYRKIAQVSADENGNFGNHIYNYDDFDVARSGVYYYRIKQVDKNKIFTYSRIASVKIENSKDLDIAIYPNPTDDILNIELGLLEDSELEVRVFDEKGKNVFTNPFGGFRKAGTYKEMLNTKVLIPGQYSLQIKTNSRMINKKFTVVR
ncbi:MAG: DUF11 domain-containing protein [Saprospiraceae bacterium]|nr:DUF11 domain-containing protein [Saprospiraceae bacterium]